MVLLHWIFDPHVFLTNVLNSDCIYVDLLTCRYVFRSFAQIVISHWKRIIFFLSKSQQFSHLKIKQFVIFLINVYCSSVILISTYCARGRIS